MKLRVLLVTAALLGSVLGEVKNPETQAITVQQGVIRGVRQDAGHQRYFWAFKGIPYAKPPVGPLRFKAPEPAESWSGVRESVKPPACPQLNYISLLAKNLTVDGDEDCLFLNVYSSMLLDAPVLVFIHGGGYLFGNAEMFGGSPLPFLTRNVVLVSIQYRLGTLGFLSTEDDILPGNLGLRDQTLALRWVKDNIHAFGGDPNRITIFGQSAGAGSVHLQMLSPLAEGLFHRAIMQSGNALCHWSLRNDHKASAARIGKYLNCTGVGEDDSSLDSSALLTCLMEASATDLSLAIIATFKWSFLPFAMAPRVDGEFLPAHPAQLVREGRYHKVDIITGVTSHEGATILKLMFSENMTLAKDLKQQFQALGPLAVGTEEEKGPETLARRIFYHYLGNDLNITEENADQLVEMFSDTLMNEANEVLAEFHTRDIPFGRKVYKYRLEHRGEISFGDLLDMNTTYDDSKYVSHGEDILYLFDDNIVKRPLQRENDLFLQKIMVFLWTNFAATGDPTPDLTMGFRWSPASPSNLHYLSLTPTPQMHKDTTQEMRKFMKDLPTKANQLLYPDWFPDVYLGV